MSIFDKRMGKEKRASFELAEDSREREWKYPSFVSRLFQGAVEWDLIHPFPEQPKADKEEGDRYLKKLEEFLRKNIDPEKIDETREIPPEVMKGLFEIGAFAVKVPKEYGGLGFSQMNFSRIIHLVCTSCGSTAATLSAHQSIGVPQPLILFGTKEQKEKYLPMFRQGAISGFALTEQYAGSDPRMVKTTATPVDGGNAYLLNGEKLWCTNGNIADVLVVMAQTPPKIVDGKEKKRITAFIVETKTPGFEIDYRCDFMGLKAIQNGVIKFKDVKVPKENIILGEGEGLKLAFVTLNTGRLTLPALVTAAGKYSLYVSREWAKVRKQWGSPIGEHEAIASKLSYMASTVFAMDAVTWLVTSMADDKRFDIRLEAAMSKLFCTEEAWKIINEAVQVRGGRGYETASSLKGRGEEGYPLERAMRDLRVNTVLEGSSEIMRLFIAREALDFHLKTIGSLFNPKIPVIKKMQVVLMAGLKYMLWYPRLWLPCISAGRMVRAKRLKKHVRFVRRASKRLARDIFHKMALYQKKLVSKQNILGRFIDIGTELFAMSCTLSYADSLLEKGEKEKNSVELADLYCRKARIRIECLFADVNNNYDKLSNAVAKKLLLEEFDWLEDNIIK